MAYERIQIECPHCGLLGNGNGSTCWYCEANLETGVRRYGQWAGHPAGKAA